MYINKLSLISFSLKSALEIYIALKTGKLINNTPNIINIMVFENLVKKFILKNFFKIELSSIEKDIALEAIKKKYAPSIFTGLVQALLILPAILFLNTEIIVSVLIPVTIVAGTAWFSISLANIKKKFEDFGLELTTNMFESFFTSLLLLFALALLSLFKDYTMGITGLSAQYPFLDIVSAILASFVVFRMLYLIFIGAMKYDINDSMLSGQNEAAEKFFKKSLSLLHTAAENLRLGKGLQVANYYIGLCLYELFSYVKSMNSKNEKLNGKMDASLKDANSLIFNPAMDQDKADKISLGLIEYFLGLCVNVNTTDSKKSYSAIKDEIECLKKNNDEEQSMTDTRFSIIFSEIANMLDAQGESLFIEKKQ